MGAKGPRGAAMRALAGGERVVRRRWRPHLAAAFGLLRCCVRREVGCHRHLGPGFRTRRSRATLPPFLRPEKLRRRWSGPLPGPRPHPRPQPDSRCGPGALGTEALRLRGLRNAGRSVDVARPYVGGKGPWCEWRGDGIEYLGHVLTYLVWRAMCQRFSWA